MTTVEYPRDVGHMATRSSVGNGDPVASDSNNPDDAAAVDDVVVKEEICMIDEEIDSVEGEDDEDKMLQLALVNSVKDAPPTRKLPALRVGHGKAGYGLRGRRHQAHSNEVGEDNGDSSVSDLDPGRVASARHMPPSTATYPQHQGTPSTYQQSPQGEMKNAASTALGKPQQGTLHRNSSTNKKPPPISTAGSAERPTSNSAKRRRSGQEHQPMVHSPVTSHFSSTVPNPLSMSTPASLPPPVFADRPATAAARCMTDPLSVPCPLAVPCPLPTDSRNFQPNTSSHTPPISTIPPPAVFSAPQSNKHVTIASPEVKQEDHPVGGRQRIFSVDLDPSTFDFSDLGAIAGVDLGSPVDIPHTGDGVASGDDLAIFQGRDRAFSFEVFNFSGDDDLLPPVDHTSSMPPSGIDPDEEDTPLGRLRGDSIIFDPSSFQEGGIHEKNALEKAVTHHDNLPSYPFQTIPSPNPENAGSSVVLAASPRQAHRPMRPAPRGRPPASSALRSRIPNHATFLSQGFVLGASATDVNGDQENVATLPSSLSDTSANPHNSTTFQMDLLNKDGRIGIYLPAARKARIARFHAKRKMRIWRKRIKYDCRKKLADSRPRIKGRFVKRSDMDDGT